MSELLFRCPVTASYLCSGIDADAATVAAIWSRSTSIYCPYCRRLHALPIREATFETGGSETVPPELASAPPTERTAPEWRRVQRAR